MNSLDQLKQKIKKQKTKAHDKQEQTKSERPLLKLLDFFKDRQEVRLGVLYSLRTNQNQVVGEPIKEESKKINVSYIG